MGVQKGLLVLARRARKESGSARHIGRIPCPAVIRRQRIAGSSSRPLKLPVESIPAHNRRYLEERVSVMPGPQFVRRQARTPRQFGVHRAFASRNGLLGLLRQAPSSSPRASRISSSSSGSYGESCVPHAARGLVAQLASRRSCQPRDRGQSRCWLPTRSGGGRSPFVVEDLLDRVGGSGSPFHRRGSSCTRR
jgi:hypothetical protein